MKTINENTSRKAKETNTQSNPKKSFLFLALLTLLFLTVNGFSQKKFEFGFYIGTSITSMSGMDQLAASLSDTLSKSIGKDFSYDKTPRSFLFNAGGFVSYSFKPWLSVRGGVEYAPKGQKFTGEAYLTTELGSMTSQVITQQTTIKLGYLEFPLSVQLSTRSKNKPGKTYFYGTLGLSPAVKLFSKVDVATQWVERGFDSEGTTEKIIDKEYSSTELTGISGFDMGAFFSVGVGYKSVFADLKYERGLTNTSSIDNSGLNCKNNMFTIGIGVKF